MRSTSLLPVLFLSCSAAAAPSAQISLPSISRPQIITQVPSTSASSQTSNATQLSPQSVEETPSTAQIFSRYGIDPSSASPSSLTTTSPSKIETIPAFMSTRTERVTHDGSLAPVSTSTSSSGRHTGIATHRHSGEHSSFTQSAGSQHGVPTERVHTITPGHSSAARPAGGHNNISPLYPGVLSLGSAAAEATIPGTATLAPTTTSRRPGIQTVSTTFPDFCQRMKCQTLVPIALASAAFAAAAELPPMPKTSSAGGSSPQPSISSVLSDRLESSTSYQPFGPALTAKSSLAPVASPSAAGLASYLAAAIGAPQATPTVEVHAVSNGGFAIAGHTLAPTTLTTAEQISSLRDGGYVIGSQTLSAGAAATVVAYGKTFAESIVEGSTRLVVAAAGTTSIMTALPAPTEPRGTAFIVAGTTYYLSASGVLIAIGASATQIISGTNTKLYGAIVTPAPSSVISIADAPITIAGHTYTAYQAGGASDIFIAGQTLHAGGPAITIDGQILSAAPGGLVLSGTTVPLRLEPSAAAAVATFQDPSGKPHSVVTLPGTGVAILDGATVLYVGGAATEIDGQSINLVPGGVVVDGQQMAWRPGVAGGTASFVTSPSALVRTSGAAVKPVETSEASASLSRSGAPVIRALEPWQRVVLAGLSLWLSMGTC